MPLREEPPSSAPPILVGASLVFFALVPHLSAEPLRTALEVRYQHAEQAEQAIAVDLVGTVTFSDPPSTVFIQDETAGTFFRLSQSPPPAPGDRVRVCGVTFPGLYLTGIEEARFEILGKDGLPEPIAANVEDLDSGRFHYQRLSIEGIVRSVSPQEETTSLVRVALGSRVIEVHVEELPKESLPLVDSRVRVAGLAAGRINDRRQLVEPYLRCRGWNDWTILRPAASDESTPQVSLGELMTFQVGGRPEHRVRVTGELLGSFGNNELFLRDGESAIAVRLLTPQAGLLAGDRIEVIGFPAMDRFQASLADARIVTREEGGTRPAPIPISIADAQAGEHDSNLIRIEGTVTDWYPLLRGGMILLREGNRTLGVRTPELPRTLAVGAVAEATGICRVEATRGAQYRSHPETVSLHLVSPKDFRLLRAPGWWTAERLTVALIVIAITCLLAGLWIALLRRQVSRQTEALRNRIENEAILEERQRIAREFHDTLEQDLAGLTLRLDAATTRGGDSKLTNLIEGSRHLVTRIQSEARNLVSDLRDVPGEHGYLDEALLHLREETGPDPGPEIILTAEEMPPLPSRTTHHLKMIAREAITNARKHAKADRIEITATVADSEIRLAIQDNGIGLDEERDTHGTPGHFGCMGIRERARRINADVSWQSSRETGTRVLVTLPLPR